MVYKPRLDSDEKSEVVYLDLSGLNSLDLDKSASARVAWDMLHLVSTLQGIVNRDGPMLFIRFMPEIDDFWWEYLRHDHGWLTDRKVTQIDTIEQLLDKFTDSLRGVVAYQEHPWVGSNLASTIAGVEDRLALRWDESPGSVCQRVLNSGHAFASDRLDLFDTNCNPVWRMGSSQPASDKCEAYFWLKRRCLDTGLVSRQYMGYYIDAYWLTDPARSELPNCTLTNHDFFVSQRAFFMDLHVWEEETPVDEPDQQPGTDLKTLRELMRAMHDHAEGGIIHIGGFTPWAWKYSSYPGAGSAHGGVDTEWKMVKEVSAYNALIDADALSLAGLTNASFYQHFPLEDHYPQNPRPNRLDHAQAGLIDADGRVADKTYILLYMGDYDSAAWLNKMVPQLWNDPARGRITCNWAFNPDLDRRAPHVMHYVRTHQSANDWFIAGDNGAGYLNPSMLSAPRPEADMPDGWAAWIEHNRAYYERYDLSITGFLIEGHSPGLDERGFDAYASFSPDGLVCHRLCNTQGVHGGTLPYVRHTQDIGDSPKQAADKITAELDATQTQFLFFRSVIQTPSWHAEVFDLVKQQDDADRVRFVDPYTFFGLLKRFEQQRVVVTIDPRVRPGAVSHQTAET